MSKSREEMHDKFIELGAQRKRCILIHHMDWKLRRGRCMEELNKDKQIKAKKYELKARKEELDELTTRINQLTSIVVSQSLSSTDLVKYDINEIEERSYIPDEAYYFKSYILLISSVEKLERLRKEAVKVHREIESLKKLGWLCANEFCEEGNNEWHYKSRHIC